MKLFKCIVDDGKQVFKSYTAAKSKKELLNIYGGNGTFEKIVDVTSDFFNEESAEHLNECLLAHGKWSEGERKLICALLDEHITNMR